MSASEDSTVETSGRRPVPAQAAPGWPGPAWLPGLGGGAGPGWHAIRPIQLPMTPPEGLPMVTAPGVCGELATIAVRRREARPPVYERDDPPPWRLRCPECAWTVAVQTGEQERQIQLLIPSPADRAVLARFLPDPLIAVTAARAIAESASSEHRPGDELDHPAIIGLLAAITRHRPVVVLPEECAQGECEHYPGGYDVQAGGPFICPRPQARVACGTCSLKTGSGPGEWEGKFRAECTVPAPCAVLTRLAAHATEALAQMRRNEESAASDGHEMAAGGRR